MRRSKVLAKWRAGEFARFCSMGHVLPFYIRYAAHYRYDGIWLDLEHRNFDIREVQHLLALCHRYDIDCMIRPPTTQRARLYRLLEDGATGLMIPFVSDAETAREIVMAAKFPPMGNRGLDGAGPMRTSAWTAGSPTARISRTRIARPSSLPRSKRQKRSPMQTRSPQSRALTRYSSVRPILACALRLIRNLA